jgi:hypothetical protein
MVIRREPGLEEGNRSDKSAEDKVQAPSQNVINLQRRVAGILPVRVDVPRASTAYQFVKSLVLDEETRVSFKHKRR